MDREMQRKEGTEKRRRCEHPICGGNGNCATCRVGMAMEDEKTQFDVISEHQRYNTIPKEPVCGSMGDTSDMQKYDLVIDIGTTTLVFELIERITGKVYHTLTAVNSQRKYGTDVISRIQASIEGKRNELQECIKKDLLLGISAFEKKYGIPADRIERIVIAGNTTMIHLLKGYDCGSLGSYPFIPVNNDKICETAEDLFGSDNAVSLNAKVIILPGISAFVGGDIVSGLYAYDFSEREDICMLIDLGTNGEIAIGNKDRILVTSTAAGPAFEGGNITWGTGSVAGAVCAVDMHGTDVQVKTIQDKMPCGICGTGVIEITAELLANGMIDKTGLMKDEFFEGGFLITETADGEPIIFAQKDVREIQLAKAAIYTGVKTLLLRYGITEKQVARAYLAGGFGYRLDIKKAVLIGMLPEELKDRIEVVGNSSLAGIEKYLYDKSADALLQKIPAISEEITLAEDACFNETYMNAMMFV